MLRSPLRDALIFDAMLEADYCFDYLMLPRYFA